MGEYDDPSRLAVHELEQKLREERLRKGIKDPREEFRSRFPFGKRMLLEVALSIAAFIIIMLGFMVLGRLF